MHSSEWLAGCVCAEELKYILSVISWSKSSLILIRRNLLSSADYNLDTKYTLSIAENAE